MKTFTKHILKNSPAGQTIVIKAGNIFKNQQTVDAVISQLIGLHADRQTFIVGVGGGVVTDISGFVASVLYAGRKIRLCANKYFSHGRCQHWQQKRGRCWRI